LISVGGTPDNGRGGLGESAPGDTRAATSDEVKDLRREASALRESELAICAGHRIFKG